MAETKNQFKMPETYDFSSKSKNWSEYYKDFILRTDAVWEKEKLRDYFRLYMKCFYFDKASKRYQILEPEDIYTTVFENYAIEDIVRFQGYTPTGRTNAFQMSAGPRQKVAVSSQTNFLKQDFFELCALRFEKWDRCDFMYYDERSTKYDFNLENKDHKNYPCFREYYETQSACSDDLFDFLMELNYQRRVNGVTDYDMYRHELRRLPTIYDSPKRADKRTLTY